MCGINGIVSFKNPIDMNIIENMNSIIAHRGPDGKGTFNDRLICGLGHVRLSIIDVEGSKQPLCNENHTVWITFNGEIYNYKELREKLKGLGHRFQTHGDTETLVHLYEEYGTEMMNFLNGMFSFAIWDIDKKRLLLVRDRMGIKPLYYYEKQNFLIFSSEQKGILQHPAVSPEPNIQSLWNYFTFRSVPSPNTLYNGINKLQPGHYLIFNKDGAVVKRYWDIPIYNHIKKNRNLSKLVEDTESILIKSIKRRLISDVPLGAFLSGGIDSSLIVAIMSHLIDEPVKTYSVGFKDFPDTETGYAKIVADQYKTDHHELLISENDFLENIEKLTFLRDSPLSEPADIPLHLLSKLASEKVKILLSGEGSDELFAGYPKYGADFLSPCISKLPVFITDALINSTDTKYRKMQIAIKSLSESDQLKRWPLWFSPFNDQEKLRLLINRNFNYQDGANAFFSSYNLDSSLRSFLFFDCKIWLPDNLLDRGDKMTMGASIEGRVPFLDHEMVEWAFCLPDNLKIYRLRRKIVIKEISKKYLPKTIINRKKAGFVVPLSQWFRGKLRDYCYDMISEKNLPEDIISIEYARSILDEHVSGKKNYFLQIWTLLGLALWHNTCISNRNRFVQ